MKFYNSIGPNPRMVRFFMAEKGIDIPRVEVDLMKAENRGAAYTAKNPQGQTPSLELDDGRHLAEITAICEYLEELHPTPSLIGTSPVEVPAAPLTATDTGPSGVRMANTPRDARARPTTSPASPSSTSWASRRARPPCCSSATGVGPRAG